MDKNDEIIIGVFNGTKGMFSWAIKGECYRIIFTTERIVVGEAKLKFWQRFTWPQEFNWVTASNKEKETVERKSIQDYCDTDQIIEKIPYINIKEIKHSSVANVIDVKIYSDSGELEYSYDIPVRTNNAEIDIRTFFKSVNQLLNSVYEKRRQKLNEMSPQELAELIKESF